MKAGRGHEEALAAGITQLSSARGCWRKRNVTAESEAPRGGGDHHTQPFSRALLERAAGPSVVKGLRNGTWVAETHKDRLAYRPASTQGCAEGLGAEQGAVRPRRFSVGSAGMFAGRSEGKVMDSPCYVQGIGVLLLQGRRSDSQTWEKRAPMVLTEASKGEGREGFG